MPKVSECWISIFFFFLHDRALHLSLIPIGSPNIYFSIHRKFFVLTNWIIFSLDVPTNVYVFLLQLQVKYWTLKNVVLESGCPLVDWAHGVVHGLFNIWVVHSPSHFG